MAKLIDMEEVRFVGNVNEQITAVENTLSELRGAVLAREPLEVATCYDELDDQFSVLMAYLKDITATEEAQCDAES